jgi:hypothetical protein
VTTPPGHRPQPTATPAGQPTNPTDAVRAAARAQADQLLAAVNDAMTHTPTAIRVEDPDIPSWHDGPRIGTTPPVTDQPGTRRPPMSQGAVDLNTTLICSSVVIVAIGGAASAILWASGKADPTVIAWICACAIAAPALLAVPILALKSLMKSAKEVAEATPPTHNHHYSGHVDQRSTHVHTKTNGVVSITRNELPPATR